MLRALGFSLFASDKCKEFKDKTKQEIIKNLRKELVILKPDKGNRVVLIRANDYYTAVEDLSSDKSKFLEIDEDPTPTPSIQRYLKMLNNRNELNDEVFNKLRQQNAKLARAHTVTKVHKTFDSIPTFCPIINITGATHCSVGKYLSEPLNPLT